MDIKVELDDRHIAKAKQCIGLDRTEPYKKRGKYYYKPWRNFFAAAKSGTNFKLWEDLRKEGYAQRTDYVRQRYTFYLTNAGLKWLGEKLGIEIYGCEVYGLVNL